MKLEQTDNTKRNHHVYKAKIDVLLGVLNVLIGLLLLIAFPYFSDLGAWSLLHVLLSLALILGGLYLMNIWPWSLAEVSLGTGKIVFTYRDGRRVTYVNLNKARYHSGMNNKYQMVVMSGLDEATGKIKEVRITASDINGNFNDFIATFNEVVIDRLCDRKENKPLTVSE